VLRRLSSLVLRRRSPFGEQHRLSSLVLRMPSSLVLRMPSSLVLRMPFGEQHKLSSLVLRMPFEAVHRRWSLVQHKHKTVSGVLPPWSTTG